MNITDLDPELEKYILEHIDPEDEILYELNRFTNIRMMHPRMLSGHLQGSVLRMLSKMIRPLKILEIGTFTGYSAICLAQGMPSDGHLDTIEVNDEIADIPMRFFKKAGLSEKITMYIGNALDLIPTLSDDYDLVFLDGEKSEYLDYYTAIIDKVKHGGFILADNILWSGKVLLEEESNDYFTKGIKKFNDFIARDNRVERAILPIRDGLMVICKL